MDPDRALVADAAAGSREAFDALVERHQTRIYTLACVMTGSDADVEDLVQETFVRAFRGLQRFRGQSAFATWLHRIALNVIKSHVTRRGRHASVVSISSADRGGAAARAPGRDDVGAAPMSWLPSDEDLESDVTRRQVIDRALASLPEELRVLVALRDIQGLEYHEIATVTGLPIGTVESRVFRARQHLRPMLESLRSRRKAGAR